VGGCGQRQCREIWVSGVVLASGAVSTKNPHPFGFGSINVLPNVKPHLFKTDHFFAWEADSRTMTGQLSGRTVPVEPLAASLAGAAGRPVSGLVGSTQRSIDWMFGA